MSTVICALGYLLIHARSTIGFDIAASRIGRPAGQSDLRMESKTIGGVITRRRVSPRVEVSSVSAGFHRGDELQTR